jgi:Transposase
MNSTTIAIDVAKSVFEVAISEQPGQVRERKRLSREQFRQFLAERPAATILMEACGSAHHWARHAQAHGHQAVLVPPHVVRPYVLRNKTDRTDAKGLLEAFRNEDVHPVPVKSETQQALAALHPAPPAVDLVGHPHGPDQYGPGPAPRVRPSDSGRRPPRAPQGPPAAGGRRLWRPWPAAPRPRRRRAGDPRD